MDDKAVALPVAVGRVRVTAEGRNVILQTTKALRLLFDGDAHVLISIPSPFRGRVCGLCGNFNSNWTDDLVLPSGAEAPSVDAFGAAWRAPSSSQGCGEGCGASGCPVCLAEETAPYESNQACGQIRDPQGPFAACHAVLNPSEYFRQCVYDLCFHKGNTTFLCRSLTAYTADCQAVGGTVKSWRTDSFCRECPGGPSKDSRPGSGTPPYLLLSRLHLRSSPSLWKAPPVTQLLLQHTLLTSLLPPELVLLRLLSGAHRPEITDTVLPQGSS